MRAAVIHMKKYLLVIDLIVDKFNNFLNRENIVIRKEISTSVCLNIFIPSL